MTNQDKFKTAEERIDAFEKYCNARGECCSCIMHGKTSRETGRMGCIVHWLALEAVEDKIEPCPFCGKAVVVGFSENIHKENHRQVWCSDTGRCGYEGVKQETEAAAIAAHNRVCRAVKNYKNKEV